MYRSPLRERGQLFSDAPSKARILSEQFKSVFTIDNHDVGDTRLPGPDLPDIRPLNITLQGVEKLLKDLNPRKASETWLAGHHCDREIGDPLSFINKYEVHRRDWNNRHGGGVFVAVRKDLKSSRQSEIETDCENVWVKLEIPNSPNIYISAHTTDPM